MILKRFKCFSIYYYMYYYYIKEFLSDDLWRVIGKYPQTTITKKIIVSNDGLYKIYNNNIYKYKLVTTNSEIVSEFIGKYTLLVNQIIWKKEITYKIPFIQQGIQNITFVEYNIHPKIKFIIEKMDNEIIDFYFQSNISYQDHIIKNELTTFLSLLK